MTLRLFLFLRFLSLPRLTHLDHRNLLSHALITLILAAKRDYLCDRTRKIRVQWIKKIWATFASSRTCSNFNLVCEQRLIRWKTNHTRPFPFPSIKQASRLLQKLSICLLSRIRGFVLSISWKTGPKHVRRHHNSRLSFLDSLDILNLR